MLPKKKKKTPNPCRVPVAPVPLWLCPPACHPGHRGAVRHRQPLTCRRHVCCCLPCSGSSSSCPSSSSSLPLPAAWGSLWRFIHSCLPIGPSAFPCLPEAERVTPRPFPATFSCHRAALPQPGAAAGLGHAWAAPGRGSIPQRGVRGVGTAPTRPGGHRSSLAPVAGASGRRQGFPLCPPLSPSPRQAAAHRRWLPPSGGSEDRARVGPHPGQSSLVLSLSARPSILSSSPFLPLSRCLRTRIPLHRALPHPRR